MLLKTMLECGFTNNLSVYVCLYYVYFSLVVIFTLRSDNDHFTLDKLCLQFTSQTCNFKPLAQIVILELETKDTLPIIPTILSCRNAIPRAAVRFQRMYRYAHFIYTQNQPWIPEFRFPVCKITCQKFNLCYTSSSHKCVDSYNIGREVRFVGLSDG